MQKKIIPGFFSAMKLFKNKKFHCSHRDVNDFIPKTRRQQQKSLTPNMKSNMKHFPSVVVFRTVWRKKNRHKRAGPWYIQTVFSYWVVKFNPIDYISWVSTYVKEYIYVQCT